MMFKVGDGIVHPQHGVGKITKIVNEELVKGFDQYYAIHITGKDLTIHIPVIKADELGLRSTMSKPKLQSVFEVLRDKPTQLSGDYKLRQSLIREQLTSAMPTRVAEVVRDLVWRKDSARLSSLESNLLDQARTFLANEIVVVEGVKMEKALKLIDQNVNVSVAGANAAVEAVAVENA